MIEQPPYPTETAIAPLAPTGVPAYHTSAMKMRTAISPRIAFIDLTFNWPPVGGCWIDAYHVIQGLQDRGASVCLFTPDFQTYYPRGHVPVNLPFHTVCIPFNRLSFNFMTVMKRFRHAVEQYKPDLIFLMDGYFMKNHLLTAFGPERCFLRFYSFELLCVNLHYYRYHENRICNQGYFESPRECHRCWFRRVPALGRALQIALGFKEKHPVLHFSQEYLFSGAFSESYRHKLLDNFSRLQGAIVYNPFLRDRLAPYVKNIHVIPSGVDCERYTPAIPPADHYPVKIFLPGRANDPLKGLPVLIEAGDWLAREGLSFEIHYTAALDCPSTRPWLINQGWVDQDALPRLYQQMDIVAVPSTWIEPFGITAPEAMAAGLPVVASRIGGLQQTVEHEKTGILVEPGNPHALAEALRRLILDPDLRARFGNAGRERVLDHYNWNRILDLYYVPLVDEAMERLPRQSPLIRAGIDAKSK
ncbi:MAG TPA: glycosyltransferase family 4 protein [bacterium]|nr:glycosyltransferase family 4 protein [bacterium]HPP00501.1 glycosyltransferase family 4 protein [bacterium]